MNNNTSFQITFVIMKFLVISIRKKIIAFSISLLAMISFTACFKNLPKTQIVYQNDFETYNLNGIVVSGWLNGMTGPVTDIRINSYNGSKVLGFLNNGKITLTLTKLPPHTAISVSFDLYIHNTWRNDLWKLEYDGVTQLLTGFSNDSTIQQSYPNWLGNGSALSPAQTDAYTIHLPGTCNSSQYGSSMYKMVRTVLHSNPTFTLSCSDAGSNINDFCYRSWSIDNLTIYTINNQ